MLFCLLSFSFYLAKLSPDAYIQMALQLAWMKDQGKPTAIYETASTRFFLHGRTDVIRSFSKESLLFVQSMMDERATVSTSLALLQSLKGTAAKRETVSVNRCRQGP